MTEMLDCYGNPSSIHHLGQKAKKVTDQARQQVAQLLNCTASRIVFTSCGSESNNLAIKGIAFSHYPQKNHIITSKIEHPSVLNACLWLKKFGFKITLLDVDHTGKILTQHLNRHITDKTCLLSIMLADNETGTIQSLAECVEIARKQGVRVHCDAVQAIGKIPVDVTELGVDLLTVTAHKIYGPKGIGALYVGKDVPIDALISGGGQEGGIRSGTENVPEIAGFGKAAELVATHLKKMDVIKKLRDRLERGIQSIVRDYKINGHKKDRLPNTLNVTLPTFRGESLVREMDRRGICFSSGSACHSNSSEPSSTLLAMGLTLEQAHCAVRFSLGYNTTSVEIDLVIKNLNEVISNSKNIVRFVSCK